MNFNLRIITGALALAAAAVISPAASTAGELNVTTTLTGEPALHYTGEVYYGDAAKIEGAVEVTGITLILIDSPGGMAYEGVALNRMARRLGLRTMAGNSFGAWSAAGLLWVGGSLEYESETAAAGFHYAYVPGRPDIKTDTINSIMANCLLLSLRNERATEDLLHMMDQARTLWGWAGFVVFTKTGVTMLDVTAPTQTDLTDDQVDTLVEVKCPVEGPQSEAPTDPVMETSE